MVFCRMLTLMLLGSKKVVKQFDEKKKSFIDELRKSSVLESRRVRRN